MERLLLKAVQTRQKIEMIYLNSDQRASHRIIRVLSFSETMVTAFCFKRGQIRTFKKDRILSIQPYYARRPGA
ncbi:hypothetical protein SAMN05216238_101147 [Lentibacillus persicus]|uniref:WYL domain-containing protein n=1 Tax=Lentibacillus persicus TaxID=640948 RepID=A0A1I1RZF3_9BACI|nr:WYL domain-containing protein [Lentibacillus persicus]SFD39676.1 hypothetical protein SAMN05216238_101147 [Lentibacillus persicus]